MKHTIVEEVQTSGGYYCISCYNNFRYATGELRCPKCYSAAARDLVLIDVFAVAEEETMRMAGSRHGE
ncbi:MAG: hypothetical protein K8F91_17800 [Candidatus Obscuribacterales bacterium]|nr:hypothetical protein [Candidatus Obscuribacterales bacterium]